VMKVIPLVGLSQKDVSGAFSEATLLSKIRHPHIVGYLDAWVENCHLYIVMEYCSGGDLSARLQSGRIAESELWQCARDITCGLEFLHNKRIMHRCEDLSKYSPVNACGSMLCTQRCWQMRDRDSQSEGSKRMRSTSTFGFRQGIGVRMQRYKFKWPVIAEISNPVTCS
jgi:hypothetical protein